MPSIVTHSAAEPGLLVNSYLVDTGDGIAVVDTGLLRSDALALRARLDALRAPLRAVFLTHPHPDHVNGTAELLRGRDVPVHATPAVAAAIAASVEPKRAQWGPVYGDEWPTAVVTPTDPVPDGGSVVVGGTTFTVQDCGPAESDADSVWTATADGSTVAFVGDVAFSGTHAYLADGHTGRWLDVLDRLEAELAGVRTLLPGHGPAAGAELWHHQRRYLLMVREAVRGRAGDGRLTDADRDALVATMTRFAPDAPLSWMVALGADAVAHELAGRAA
jgi:glyoxylase-like metal-dependent hydrolase (beta-lactamase superfamily II)